MAIRSLRSFLNEASLSRIWSKVQDHEAGAITGYRGSNSKSTNKQNNKRILSVLKKKGYSVISVKGSYIENKGSADEREVGEPSFFVIDIQDSGKLERDLRALGSLYDQDSVLVVPKGGKGAYLVGTSRRDNAWPDYGKKEVVGNARFGKAAGEFLSRVRGRKFAFEDTNPETINGIRGQQILATEVEAELEPFYQELD